MKKTKNKMQNKTMETTRLTDHHPYEKENHSPLDGGASSVIMLQVNEVQIAKKREQLLAQLANARQSVAVIEGQLTLLDEVTAGGPVKKVSLADEALTGMAILGEFSKKDLDRWIRARESTPKFNIKSLDRVFAEATSEGKLQLLRSNVGNKIAAVYKWMPK